MGDDPIKAATKCVRVHKYCQLAEAHEGTKALHKLNGANCVWLLAKTGTSYATNERSPAIDSYASMRASKDSIELHLRAGVVDVVEVIAAPVAPLAAI